MLANFDPIVGRYVYLTLQGREHRVYFEEAGEGVPLLCLHTAGADGIWLSLMLAMVAKSSAPRRARLASPSEE